MSTLVTDADRLSFADFDLRRWLDSSPGQSRARRWGLERFDAFEARIDDGAVHCRGSLAGGATFGCGPDGGWIRILRLDIEVLTAFRGPLREVVDNALIVARDYRVTSGHIVVGTTVLRFACSVISADELTARS